MTSDNGLFLCVFWIKRTHFCKSVRQNVYRNVILSREYTHGIHMVVFFFITFGQKPSVKTQREILENIGSRQKGFGGKGTNETDAREEEEEEEEESFIQRGRGGRRKDEKLYQFCEEDEVVLLRHRRDESVTRHERRRGLRKSQERAEIVETVSTRMDRSGRSNASEKRAKSVRHDSTVSKGVAAQSAGNHIRKRREKEVVFLRAHDFARALISRRGEVYRGEGLAKRPSVF